MADTKNWPGYGLVLVAALAAIGAALLAGWGLDGAAIAAAIIAASFLVVGVILVALERRRGRARDGRTVVGPGG